KGDWSRCGKNFEGKSMKKRRRRKQRTDSNTKPGSPQRHSEEPILFFFSLARLRICPVESLGFLFSLCLCDSVVNKPGAPLAPASCRPCSERTQAGRRDGGVTFYFALGCVWSYTASTCFMESCV